MEDGPRVSCSALFALRGSECLRWRFAIWLCGKAVAVLGLRRTPSGGAELVQLWSGMRDLCVLLAVSLPCHGQLIIAYRWAPKPET